MMSFWEMILGCLLLIFQVSLALTCPSGFMSTSISTCIKIVYESNGFDTVVEANDVCAGLGAYMARALTNDDWALMQNMIQDAKSNYNLVYAFAYLGGSDIDMENDFVWTNGISIDPSFWKTGEPNDMNGEDCIVIKHTGEMIDRPCCSRGIRAPTFVICEYDPAGVQSASDDVFYEKCRADTSTIRVQTSSGYIPSSIISTDNILSSPSDSVITSKESITQTGAMGHHSATTLPDTPSGEFTTSGQEESSLSQMTEYPKTPLVITSSAIGESLYPTPRLDTSDTDFISTSHIITNIYSSSSVVFSSENRPNFGSAGNTSYEFYGTTDVEDLLNITSPDFISMTPGPQNSSRFTSVTPTQMPYVTVTNQDISYTLSPVVILHRTMPLIPQMRRQCSNKNQTQYKANVSINMLRVERNETQRFKRKLSCAQDNRMSSLIIGVVSCILPSISYLFIVFTDLLERRSKHQRC